MQQDTYEVNKTLYKVLRKLGEGRFANVYLVEEMQGKRQYAMKILKNDDLKSSGIQFQMEVETLKQLDHDHIVKLIDHQELTQDGELQRVIIVDVAQNRELFKYIKAGGFFPEPIARYYFQQLIEIISYLQEKGISHRDLKSENILIDENFDLKLVDFGLACQSKELQF